MSIRPGLQDRLENIAFALYSCGLCCHDRSQCRECVKNTLGSAGLEQSESNISRVFGKSKDYPGVQWGYQYSDAAKEVRKMIAEGR